MGKKDQQPQGGVSTPFRGHNFKQDAACGYLPVKLHYHFW